MFSSVCFYNSFQFSYIDRQPGVMYKLFKIYTSYVLLWIHFHYVIAHFSSKCCKPLRVELRHKEKAQEKLCRQKYGIAPMLNPECCKGLKTKLEQQRQAYQILCHDRGTTDNKRCKYSLI